jgi:hypothetical protein
MSERIAAALSRHIAETPVLANLDQNIFAVGWAHGGMDGATLETGIDYQRSLRTEAERDSYMLGWRAGYGAIDCDVEPTAESKTDAEDAKYELNGKPATESEVVAELDKLGCVTLQEAIEKGLVMSIRGRDEGEDNDGIVHILMTPEIIMRVAQHNVEYVVSHGNGGLCRFIDFIGNAAPASWDNEMRAAIHANDHIIDAALLYAAIYIQKQDDWPEDKPDWRDMVKLLVARGANERDVMDAMERIYPSMFRTTELDRMIEEAKQPAGKAANEAVRHAADVNLARVRGNGLNGSPT